MKFLVILACVVAVAHSQRANAFSSFGSLRPQVYRPKVYSPQVVAPAVPAPVYTRNVLSGAGNANVVKLGNEVNPDGSYSYYYETDNGIAAQEQGSPRAYSSGPSAVVANVAQGSFSWTSPEGVPVSISYVADENGYQPTGNAIPTPPPVPPQIARALEYIARAAPARRQ